MNTKRLKHKLSMAGFKAKAQKDEPITEFDIVDHGMEHSQYFQGHGTSFTDWEATATGAGNTPEEAIEDAVEQIAQQGWEISDELEKEVEQFKKEGKGHYVGTECHIRFDFSGNEITKAVIFEATAKLLQKGKEKTTVDDSEENAIIVTVQAGSADECLQQAIDKIGDSGKEFSMDIEKKTGDEARDIDDNSEHYYYVSIDVK